MRSYLSGADERQQQRDQDDPFLKVPHDVSTAVAALRREAGILIPGPSIQAFKGAGRSRRRRRRRRAGSGLIYPPVCAINDCS